MHLIGLSLFILGCQSAPDSQTSSTPSSSLSAETSASPTPGNCPADFIEIPAASELRLGESDQALLQQYGPNDTIGLMTMDTAGYCIARWPAPGVKGAEWPTDGLSFESVGRLESMIARFGIRLCTVAELLYAASGPDNRRYPSEAHTGEPVLGCERDDQSPRPIGSFPHCASPFGVEDLSVRSSWSRLDAYTAAALAQQREALTPPAGGLAIWGGTARTDTYYAPNNYGVHFHGQEETPYSDDSVRFCADLGSVSPESEQLLAAWLGVFSATPTFAAVLAR